MEDNRSDTELEPCERLEKARLSAGFRFQADACKRFGWSEQSYSQHENGTRGLSRVYRKYAKAFKVDPSWLLYGEGKGPSVPADTALRLSPEVIAEIESQVSEFRQVMLKNAIEKLRNK